MPELLQEVSIEAGVGVYRHFRGYDLDAWTCLGEYVDNSLGSYEHPDTKKYLKKINALNRHLNVTIYRDTEKRSIRIKDNAGGIPDHELERALKIGDRPAYAQGYNEFGVGMKMASFWFCSSWTITTSALGETDEKVIEFDVDEIERHNKKTLDIQRTKKVSADLAYTEIELRNIYSEHWPSGKTIPKIFDHLSSMYRRMTAKQKLKLIFNDDGKEKHLEFNHPAIDESPYVNDPNGEPELWKVDIDFHKGNKQIFGWVGILKKSSGVDAGFTLLRRNRVIEGQDRSWKPNKKDSANNGIWSGNSEPKARLFGEFNFRGFEVSNNKSVINWGLDSENIKEEFLESLVSKIKFENRERTKENWSRFWNQLWYGKKIIEVVEGEAAFEEYYADQVDELANTMQYGTSDLIIPEINDLSESDLVSDVTDEIESDNDYQEISYEIMHKDEQWKIIIIPAPAGGTGNFFELESYQTDENPKVLKITWDPEHQFSAIAKLTNSEVHQTVFVPIFHIVASLCVAEVKVADDPILQSHDMPVGASYFRDVINKILSTIK